MDISNLPAETQVALSMPIGLILIIDIILICLCVGFLCGAKKYVKEIKERFPGLNFKINCILLSLMFMTMVAQIIQAAAMGQNAHAGMGWLNFCISKYFISKRIINNDSEYGYISNTILIYVLTFLTINLLVLGIIGGVL